MNFGGEFFGDLKPWKNKAKKFAIKIRHQNSLRNSPAIFLKFAGPKKKNHPKSALHNDGTKSFLWVVISHFPIVERLVVRIARPTSLAIWHRRRLHRRPNRSGSPNRRRFPSLDLKKTSRFFASQANIARYSQAFSAIFL